MARGGLLAAALVGGAAPLAAQLPNGASASWPIERSLPLEARQFDFWVGEWDVNLRVLQSDLDWEDTHQAVARIYPILRGKAVLELWDAPAIKGFSVRYFDTHLQRWVLWLNWPGTNRSGSSSLSGSFRHGRGEFFSTRTNPGGGETISRYSFSDITPTSLRWDDAFSSDAGRSWTHGWIMEFTRRLAVPRLSPWGGDEHTFVNGGRCDLDRFRSYDFLSGRRLGVVTESGQPVTSELRAYRVLDGCALIAFIDDGGGPEAADAFAHITWNTYARRFELLLLDADPDSPARVLFTAEGAEELIFEEAGTDGDPPRLRVRIEGNGEGVLWIEESREGDGWRQLRRGVFGAPM